VCVEKEKKRSYRRTDEGGLRGGVGEGGEGKEEG